jgi:hypothetical protein
MKICTKCGPPAQPVDQYAWRYKARGVRSSVCRTCQSKYGKQHYHTYRDKYIAKAGIRNKIVRKAARDFVLGYLREHPCVDCGESDPVVLEFDHQHGKITEVGNFMRAAASLKTLREEIATCEVVCANCHKRRTAKRFHWYKL